MTLEVKKEIELNSEILNQGYDGNIIGIRRIIGFQELDTGIVFTKETWTAHKNLNSIDKSRLVDENTIRQIVDQAGGIKTVKVFAS